MIVPFVGYQFISGDVTGVDYSVQVNDPSFPDQMFTFDSSFKRERDYKSPVVGFSYRYRLNDAFRIDGLAAILQDQFTVKYPAIFQVYQFTQSVPMTVVRTNTMLVGADLSYEFDTPLQWLTGAIRGGLGYGFRETHFDWPWLQRSGDYADAKIKIFDATRLMTARFGADGLVWKSDNLLLQAGISYTRFFPLNGDGKSFGGIGWRVGVFPIWSAVSSND